ncbi:hypothetical protein, partial [Gemmatimonas sp.]
GPSFDSRARNPFASWRDPQGITHTVWYLDAATAWNQLRAATAAGVASMALWRLGGGHQVMASAWTPRAHGAPRFSSFASER